MENNFNIIIIGAGPGGYKTALYAAQNGLSVLIVEQDELGGTCLNKGCIPTKAYARHAEILQTLHHATEYGLEKLNYKFDFKTAVNRKDTVIAQLREGISTLLSVPGITLVKGKAQFATSNSIHIGGQIYTAENIIIATGSEAKSLSIDQLDTEMVCDTTWVLQTTQLPQRICIIGAGVIGMEFASILNAFGCHVSVVEFMKECLPALDSDIAKRLRKCLEKRGVDFYMQSAIQCAAHGKVTFERKGKNIDLEADKVLLAVGRKPRTEGIDLEQIGIEYNSKGIAVDNNMQTNIPHIYAVGDVNGLQMLAHAAEMQGKRAVNHILNKADNIKLSVTPAAIFTHPEAACVGMTEEQCKAQGMAYTCKKNYYRANGKAVAMNETDGMLKLLADNTGKIIGCHVYGAHAADLVQEVSTLMCRNTTLQELHDMTHIHPTLSEIIVE